jgi:hypothetical protein
MWHIAHSMLRCLPLRITALTRDADLRQVDPEAYPAGRIPQRLLVVKEVVESSERLRRTVGLLDNKVCGMQTTVCRTCPCDKSVTSM